MMRVFIATLFTVALHAVSPASQPIECELVPFVRTILNDAVSSNWSGYVGASNLSNPAAGSVSAVAGSWTVPALHPTKVTAYCATWVGIDGFTSDTVEQIGTEQTWINGSQQNYAWYEMFPQGSFQIAGFPVHVGDLITAEVEYIGNNTFQMTIENVTRGKYYTVPTSRTQSSVASRSCAEWILEAPSSNTGVLPLAHFGNETFSRCSAVINGVSAPIANSSWQSEKINMETSRGVLKSFPSSLLNGGANFQVYWEHQ